MRSNKQQIEMLKAGKVIAFRGVDGMLALAEPGKKYESELQETINSNRIPDKEAIAEMKILELTKGKYSIN